MELGTSLVNRYNKLADDSGSSRDTPSVENRSESRSSLSDNLDLQHRADDRSSSYTPTVENQSESRSRSLSDSTSTRVANREQARSMPRHRGGRRGGRRSALVCCDKCIGAHDPGRCFKKCHFCDSEEHPASECPSVHPLVKQIHFERTTKGFALDMSPMQVYDMEAYDETEDYEEGN